jgi:hypothetical protein
VPQERNITYFDLPSGVETGIHGVSRFDASVSIPAGLVAISGVN